ncbi:MAG TPA: DNA polymerase III subunit chi [Sphingomonas sp.]|nr:DNA polymerase III subunit chi [Sphingomonas sp.]
MQVDFYHLTTSPLERVLPILAERVIGGGGRLLIVSAEDRLAPLDRLLWTYKAESFLPHACAGGDADADQPILLATAVESANGARNVLFADGVWRDEALGFDRAFHLFDEDRIREARLTWKSLADREGADRRYWKQDESGRWEQAA